MQYIGDTKYGKFVAKDKYGNSYYENDVEELPCMLTMEDVIHCPSIQASDRMAGVKED